MSRGTADDFLHLNFVLHLRQLLLWHAQSGRSEMPETGTFSKMPSLRAGKFTESVTRILTVTRDDAMYQSMEKSQETWQNIFIRAIECLFSFWNDLITIFYRTKKKWSSQSNKWGLWRNCHKRLPKLTFSSLKWN